VTRSTVRVPAPRRVPKLSEMVANDIRRSIVRGDLKAGEMLPSEAELTVQLGISRPTLREALRILETESLVRIKRGAQGGAQVLAPDPDVAARYAGVVLQGWGTTLGEIYVARVALEPVAAAALAEHHTDEILAELDRVLRHEEETIEDPAEFARASALFHRRVVALAGNNALRLFEHILSEIVDVQTVFATLDGHDHRPNGDEGDDPGERRRRFRRSHQTHVRLFELVQAQRSIEAENWWRKHMQALAPFMQMQSGAKLIDVFGADRRLHVS
jgi:DNA-binding FadR family transcriptional regulator